MGPCIVHAASFAAPYGGNFIASLTALVARCAQDGWRTILAFPEEARGRAWTSKLIAEGYHIRFLPSESSILCKAHVLSRIVSEECAFIIHTHFTAYDVAAWIAARLFPRRGRKVPVIWHAHSELQAQLTPLRLAKNTLKHRWMGRSAWVVPVADSVGNELRVTGFPPSRIRMIGNAIDLERATTVHRSRADALLELGANPVSHVLLMFGWEPIRKGVDVAIDAVGELVREGIPVILSIGGTENLEHYVRGRMGNTSPPWLHLLRPTENVADLYRASAMFLSPSRSEGLPFSVCEAMANGIPVVLSDIPSVSFAHATPGAVYFPCGDSRALAKAIQKVLRWSPAERELYGRENEDLIRRDFDVRIWSERVTRVYREILQGDR
jgi:glycosyltransferase involved in cell wall biosynthesis